MQLSQTLSSAIAQIKNFKQSNYKSHKKDLAPDPSAFFFQFLYNLKDKFFVDCFNGAFQLFFCLWLLLLSKKDFEGLLDVFPL